MSTWRQRMTITLDPVMLFTVALLLLVGLTMMTSASIAVAERETGFALYYLKRQGVFLLLGLACASVLLWVPTRWWESTGFVWLSVALVLLALVLLPGIGHTVNGATRWIRLGGFNLQVSEVARVLLFIYVCSYLVRHGPAVRETTMGFVRPMLFVVLACALLLNEPDFGAACVLLGSVLVAMFIGGVRLRDYAILVVGALSAMAIMVVESPYRMKRLSGFLKPEEDLYGKSFQLSQSLLAIPRGELTGVGLGGSVQKMMYLPEAHTDFVFAILAEELGLIGVIVTLALFFVLVARGFAIARKAARFDLLFQAYLAYTLATWFALQAIINVGVNLGVLPTKGLTLPFISYGNNALIMALVSVALLLRVHHETTRAEQDKLSARGPSRGAFQ